jgi:hypothetical protein
MFIIFFAIFLTYFATNEKNPEFMKLSHYGIFLAVLLVYKASDYI